MRPSANDRNETAAARLRQALDLHEAGVAMMRLSLVRRFGPEEGEQRLRAWLLEADGEMPGFEPATLRRRAAERGDTTRDDPR